MRTKLRTTLAVLVTSTLLLSAQMYAAESTTPQSVKSVGEILEGIKNECDNPKISNESAFASYLSETELKRSKYISDLKLIGKEAISQVRAEFSSAKGEHREMLAIALAALGDDAGMWHTSQLMLKSETPAVRVCAAHELRKLQDKRMTGSFKQTFSDPFKRMDGSCVNKRMIYPVRLIAASALAKLGVPFNEVQNLGKTSD